MKHKRTFLFLLAVLLVVGMSVGAAWAYFTASDVAKGGYKLNIGYTPPISEKIYGEKLITISSKAGSPTVFIRAKAITGTLYQDLLAYADLQEYSTKGWVKGSSSDFYYYTTPLEGGTTANTLQVTVSYVLNAVHSQQELQDQLDLIGDEINIIVVYESTPAVYTADGKPDFQGAWGTNDAPAAD